MVNLDIVNYLKEGISLGNPVTVLETNLINAGWPEEQVDEASEFVQTQEIQENKEKKNYSLGVGNLGRKKKPVGIVLISFFHWIVALYIVLGTIFSLYGQSSMGREIFGILFEFFSFSLIFVALIVAILPAIVGIGVWKGINGWRIVSIVFGSIFTFLGILNLFNPTAMGIIYLLISGYIVGYLSFNKQARRYFHKKN